MSAEKIISVEHAHSSSINPEMNEEKSSGIVDINHLLARVRSEKHEENKVNMIFFGLFGVLVLIVGILLSF